METNITRNQYMVIHNDFQKFNKHKRVLCVCSVGCLRSPTAAYVLSMEPFNCNTRAAGIDPEISIVPISAALVEWADEIVVMNSAQKKFVSDMFKDFAKNKPIFNLDITDSYDYRDPSLINQISDNYSSLKSAYLRDTQNENV